jgi:hypothetical protein
MHAGKSALQVIAGGERPAALRIVQVAHFSPLPGQIIQVSYPVPAAASRYFV